VLKIKRKKERLVKGFLIGEGEGGEAQVPITKSGMKGEGRIDPMPVSSDERKRRDVSTKKRQNRIY